MQKKLISFLLMFLAILFNFLNISPIFADTYIKDDIANNQLAQKYCDSLEKNLFKGLDKESILKYEYFFSSVPDDSIKDKNHFLEDFKNDVKTICAYNLSKSNEKEFIFFLNNYFKNRSITPKIKVEARKPIPINPAIIPVFK